jgi:hypothetical protein
MPNTALLEPAGRAGVAEADRRRLLVYAQADQPFSLMFRAYLDRRHVAEP